MPVRNVAAIILAGGQGERLSVPVGPREHMVRDYAQLSQRRLDIRLPAQSVSETDWTIRHTGMKVVSAPCLVTPR